MTDAFSRPPRKNPVLRTPLPTLPPSSRSRVGLGLTEGGARGRLELQRCEACGALQYPPREACCVCLSTDLPWGPVDGAGELISETVLRHAQELFFRERAPWRLGLVSLDAGATVVAHVHRSCAAAPSRVRVRSALDRAGQGVLVAMPEAGSASLADDPKLRDMTCDPRFRKALVSDAKSAVGQAVVRALAEAGAEVVWAGVAEPWKKPPGFESLERLPNVTLVPLDVTDSLSVRELAGEIGFKVDIMVNTADHNRASALLGRQGVETATTEMDVNCFGLMRLAQAFGPVLKARGADGRSSAAAWVNLLSIHALTSFPPHATYAASKAAALSLAQALRAELQPGGIRVINMFPGPIDDEWNQLILPPKITPSAVARAIVDALRGSVEDVYPGEVAQEWLARWLDGPKTLERELAR